VGSLYSLNEFGCPLCEEREATVVVLGEAGSAGHQFAVGDTLDSAIVPEFEEREL
jgi:hypothetical protein